VLDELNERAKQIYIEPVDFAIIYTGLGEKDRAFEWLEKYIRIAPVLLMSGSISCSAVSVQIRGLRISHGVRAWLCEPGATLAKALVMVSGELGVVWIRHLASAILSSIPIFQ
jgi:hypothetical protein